MEEEQKRELSEGGREATKGWRGMERKKTGKVPLLPLKVLSTPMFFYR